jgi:DNA-binding transcriptional LysR family regulator
MREIELRDFVLLNQIYREGSVSKAAEKIGLSQPSVSIRLRQLREHFDDKLFVRTSKGMLPTPQAQETIRNIEKILDIVDITLNQRVFFDPATSDRTFRICMTDIGQMVILPKLVNYTKAIASNVQFEVIELDSSTTHKLENGDADIAMGYTNEFSSGLYQQKLFDETFVCMLGKTHPRIKDTLSVEELQLEEHVCVCKLGTSHGTLDVALRRAGVHRRSSVIVPSFLGLASIVARTELLSIVPIHLGNILTEEDNVRTIPLPIDLPSYPVKQYWHDRYHRDPTNRWLRSVLTSLFAE